MVVDDAMFIHASLKKILEQAGFEIAGEAENEAAEIGALTSAAW